MNRNRSLAVILTAAVVLTLLAAPADAGWRNRVFAMADQNRNEVVVYDRERDGTLTLRESVRTGGRGIASRTEPVDALGSQGPVIVNRSGRWVLAVNPASNTISVLRNSRAGLTLSDVVDSGGLFPASLTLGRGNLVYVLNSGGEANITGFRLAGGTLVPIPGSTRALDVGGDNPPFFLVSPAQVGLNLPATQLAVTIKGSNEIRIFGINADGTPSAVPFSNISNGNTPFGFAWGRNNRLFVVEAFGNLPVGSGAAGAVSSYSVDANGIATVISGSVDGFQTAACWLVHRPGSPFAFSTNNASDTVSTWTVSPATGAVALLDGAAGATGHAPVDFAVTRNGQYVYVHNAGSGTVSAFEVRGDGTLWALGEVHGLPEDAGSVGLAVR